MPPIFRCHVFPVCFEAAIRIGVLNSCLFYVGTVFSAIWRPCSMSFTLSSFYPLILVTLVIFRTGVVFQGVDGYGRVFCHRHTVHLFLVTLILLLRLPRPWLFQTACLTVGWCVHLGNAGASLYLALYAGVWMREPATCLSFSSLCMLQIVENQSTANTLYGTFFP